MLRVLQKIPFWFQPFGFNECQALPAAARDMHATAAVSICVGRGKARPSGRTGVAFPATCITSNTASLTTLSDTRFGWTAGVGGEWMFAPNWSAKAEYLYYDLGSASLNNSQLVTTNGTFPGAGGPAIVNVQSNSLKFNGSIARFGINYHFGGPVAATY